VKEWTDIGDGLKQRKYESDKQYLKEQAQKLKRRPEWAQNASDGLRFRLWQRLALHSDYIPKTGSVLCLGARLGGETEAFIQHGYFAVGLDINPGKSNKHVLYGDFHELQFADNSIDIIYTNSLDHVLDMDKVISEVVRTLRSGGIFMTENKGGTHEPGFKGAKSDGYDCYEWLSLQHLIDYITARGFELHHRYRFKGFTPWGIMYRKA